MTFLFLAWRDEINCIERAIVVVMHKSDRRMGELRLQDILAVTERVHEPPVGVKDAHLAHRQVLSGDRICEPVLVHPLERVPSFWVRMAEEIVLRHILAMCPNDGKERLKVGER